MAEYTLAYTATEIDARLAKTDKMVTSINGIEADENGNVEITVGSQDVNLTGYATENWVKEYAQPKGEYLTAVPAGFATEKYVDDKIAELPTTDVSREINAHNNSSTAHADLREFIGALTTAVNNCALKNSIPTKVSQLDNDSKYLVQADVASVLTQAKESGEFTPVKGVDYFTAEDKTELMNLVIAALPTWSGGNY